MYTRGDGGNAAAVVLPDENESLTDEQRAAVAKGIGFSETVFVGSIVKNGDGEVDIALRYITPTEEVDLCGHATVASLGLLYDRNLLLGATRGRLITRAGPVSFLVEPSDLPEAHMSQLPVTVDAPLGEEVTERLATALDTVLNPIWAPRVASTGLRDILVAVKDEEELARMEPNMAMVTELSEELNVVGVHAFVMPERGPPEQQTEDLGSSGKTPCIRVRNFAPLYGIDEESATGTSNCALACALSQVRPLFGPTYPNPKFEPPESHRRSLHLDLNWPGSARVGCPRSDGPLLSGRRHGPAKPDQCPATEGARWGTLGGRLL